VKGKATSLQVMVSNPVRPIKNIPDRFKAQMGKEVNFFTRSSLIKEGGNKGS
jgi:hypothetical protein